jgi:hypothetical protein
MASTTSTRSSRGTQINEFPGIPTAQGLNHQRHKKLSSIFQESLHPLTSPSPASAPAQLTYVIVLRMLQEAHADAADRYAHSPFMIEHLQSQYCLSVDDCEAADREPLEIVLTRLGRERALCHNYNKSPLVEWGHQPGMGIEEDLESFPFRLAVVDGGFPELTDFLDPIYQSENHPASPTKQPTADSATSVQVPKTPSKSRGTRSSASTEKVVYNKLQGAPPANLDFPTGNITLAEMAAFHPEAIKSWDMIDRFCANGGSSAVYATMVNHHREMLRGKIENNSVYRMMKGPMAKRAKLDKRFDNWSVGLHNHIEGLDEIDPTSVSFTGFLTPTDGKNP